MLIKDVSNYESTCIQLIKIDKLNQDKRVGPDPAQFNG